MTGSVDMYEMTKRHIEILDRLQQGTVSDWSTWADSHQTELSQLRGSGYVNLDCYWYLTLKGNTRRIDYWNKQGQLQDTE